MTDEIKIKAPRGELVRRLAQEELDWLYSGQGSSVFERSPLGRQLELMMLFSRGSEPCWSCNPDGEGESPGVAADGSWCQHCNGTGYLDAPKGGVDDDRVTARPAKIGDQRDAARESYEMDGVILRAAQLSRAARRVERESPRFGQALEAYHGPRGSRWASCEWGAYLPVIALNGAKLAEAEQKRGATGSLDELVWLWLSGAATKPNRQAARDRVVTEAKLLMVAAWGAFVNAKGVQR